jgi:predicted ATPase/DNA-binding CsgD family transcriptional regulator
MHLALSHQFYVPLIGREHELARLHNLFHHQKARLLTLTGTVGVGKSYLALHFASSLSSTYNGEVFHIQLADLHDPHLIPEKIIRGMRLRLPTHSEVSWQALTATLAEKPILLVLDTFEHLIATAPNIAQLLTECPLLSLLITSRECLRIQGEYVITLQPLALPQADAPLTLTETASTPAIDYFIQKARNNKPGFNLNQENMESVVAVCRRMDGLPLALTSAAAYMRFFTPQELLARLDHGLQLQIQGQRDVTIQYHSLDEALQWSFDLLSKTEQHLFCLLSLFQDDCNLETLEALTRDHILNGDILDNCALLADKHMITIQHTPDARTRLSMLTLLRAYGREQLAQSGTAPLIWQHFANCFLQYVQSQSVNVYTERHADYIQKIKQEHANIFAAFTHLLPDRLEDALHLWGALKPYWNSFGNYKESLEWFEHIHRAGSLPTSEYACALAHASHLALKVSNLGKARRFIRESYALASQVSPPHDYAYVLLQMGRLCTTRARFTEAQSLLEESLTLFRSHGSLSEQTQVLLQLGNVIAHLGEYDMAQNVLEDALRHFKDLNDKKGVAHALTHLALVYFYQDHIPTTRILMEEGMRYFRSAGNALECARINAFLAHIAVLEEKYSEAKALLDECEPIIRKYDYQRGTSRILVNRVSIALFEGDIPLAQKYAREGLKLARETRYFWFFIHCLEWQASILTETMPLHAAFLVGASEMLREKLQIPLPPVYRKKHFQMIETLRATLSQQDYELAWNKGHSVSFRSLLTMPDQPVSITDTPPALIDTGERPTQDTLPSTTIPNPAIIEQPVKQTAQAAQPSATEQEIQSTPTEQIEPPKPDASDTETTKTAPIIEELTKREQEVLELVAQGYSNKEVAQNLTISDRTVNAHLRSIYVKLSVNSRSGAIRAALEHHLIQL